MWKYTDSTEQRVKRPLDNGGEEYRLTTDPEYIAWVAAGNDPEPADSLDLDDAKKSVVRKIDAAADAIYRDVIGNRATEYAQAEAEAAAYKAAGYSGAVPPCVASWQAATGNSSQWCADDILATATAWRSAQAAIREARLVRKAAARAAADQAQLDAIRIEWDGFVSAIRASLGV